MQSLWPREDGTYLSKIDADLYRCVVCCVHVLQPTLLVSANVPSAKKLIVHGPDLSCIPSQFPIQEVSLTNKLEYRFAETLILYRPMSNKGIQHTLQKKHSIYIAITRYIASEVSKLTITVYVAISEVESYVIGHLLSRKHHAIILSSLSWIYYKET